MALLLQNLAIRGPAHLRGDVLLAAVPRAHEHPALEELGGVVVQEGLPQLLLRLLVPPGVSVPRDEAVDDVADPLLHLRWQRRPPAPQTLLGTVHNPFSHLHFLNLAGPNKLGQNW